MSELLKNPTNRLNNSLPKRLQGQSPAHARSPRQERSTARRFSGQPTIGSGNKFEKGDVKTSKLRIECKCTGGSSFRITRQMIKDIMEAAIGVGTYPAIEIEFIDPLSCYQDSKNLRVYVISEPMMEILNDAI